LSNGSATTPASTTTGNNSLKSNNRPKQQGSVRLQMAANSAANGNPNGRPNKKQSQPNTSKSEARAATHSSIKRRPIHQINTPTGHCLAPHTTSWTFIFYLSLSLYFPRTKNFPGGDGCWILEMLND
jgi:hypothetical protein